MTQYMICIPGDETPWEQADAETRQAVYQDYVRFAELLTERGHTILGGAELTHSREAVVVRGSLDEVTVTQGPYAESVEQLTGYYLIETDDLDDLCRTAGIIAGPGGVEIRPCVADSNPEKMS